MSQIMDKAMSPIHCWLQVCCRFAACIPVLEEALQSHSRYRDSGRNRALPIFSCCNGELNAGLQLALPL